MDIIFININCNKLEFDEYIKPLEERWSKFISKEDQKLLKHSKDHRYFSLDVKCNWKFAIENYCESYHLPWIHPELNKVSKIDSLSPVAPYRVVNIGNSNKVKLLDFINVIEEVLGKKAIRKYMSMQKGDVEATWADASLLQNLTGYSPKTNFKDGISQFIKWYLEYYNHQD